jgi:6-hydroxymethylpterin diphosphokinase MptE-like protein
MIQDFKDKRKGNVCVIIGNGPSLEQTPLGKLSRLYEAFGANKIYGLGIKPTYWTCVDSDMLHDCVSWLLAHPEFDSERFVPRTIPLPGAHQLNVVIEHGFSKDASEKVVIGGTVTYVNLQLAWYMGFTTVLLVGVDHKYPKASQGRPGYKFIAEGDDPDHFKLADGSPYFEPGKIYNRPELAATERYYTQANQVFEQAGRKIINLTPGTALDVFPKGKFEEWL